MPVKVLVMQKGSPIQLSLVAQERQASWNLDQIKGSTANKARYKFCSFIDQIAWIHYYYYFIINNINLTAIIYLLMQTKPVDSLLRIKKLAFFLFFNKLRGRVWQSVHR